MFSWLKKHFIPHHSNEHRPHILRDLSTKNIIALVIFLEIFAFILPMATNFNYLSNLAAVLPSVLGELTNDARTSQNLGVLVENPILNKAAEMKAQDMATKGYFAHTSPEGITPWYWIETAGYKYEYAGENLAVNFRDSRDVTEAWLASPTHKANIVKGNYTEMGTGVARGTYKGKNSIFVAQVYANPLPARVTALPEAPVAVVEPQVVAVAPAQEVIPDNVLGASVDEEPAGAPAEEILPALPPEITNIPENLDTVVTAEEMSTNPLEKMLASPRNTTNVILAVIFTIIATTLFLYIFIKSRDPHRDLVTNGLVVLAIIGAIFVANYEFSYRSLVVTQSLDYSLEDK